MCKHRLTLIYKSGSKVRLKLSASHRLAAVKLISPSPHASRWDMSQIHLEHALGTDFPAILGSFHRTDVPPSAHFSRSFAKKRQDHYD